MGYLFAFLGTLVFAGKIISFIVGMTLLMFIFKRLNKLLRFKNGK